MVTFKKNVTEEEYNALIKEWPSTYKLAVTRSNNFTNSYVYLNFNADVYCSQALVKIMNYHGYRNGDCLIRTHRVINFYREA